MKALIIAMVLGAVGYFVFIYEPTEPKIPSEQEAQTQSEIDQQELNDESTSYQGAITETYNRYKTGINDAKSAVQKIEERTANY